MRPKRIKRNPFDVYTSSAPSRKGKPLDWDESAADSQSFVEETCDTERIKPGLGWLAAVTILAFAVLFGRLFYLQVIQGQHFRLVAEGNRIRRQTIFAPRGLVLDRNGKTIVQNTASYNLVAVPFDLPKEGLQTELEKLGALLGLDINEVSEKLSKADRRSIEPLMIKQDIPVDQSILFETRASEFIGFSVQKIPVRDYLDAPVFSHVLGYTGLVSPEDLERLDKDRYDSVDFIGKTGLEAQYEQYLHGTNGEDLVEVDATGKLVKVLGENSPKPGDAAYLNIDKDLQKILYDSLTEGAPNTRAAAVALNPKNGEVLALVSLPGYDNNLFAHGIKNEDYKKLLNDPLLPLFNRAISGTYPPGSTVKPMVAAAALQEGTVNEKTVINDNGVLVIPNQYNPQIYYNFYGWNRRGLGPMTVRDAIAQSSDIYFYTVGGGHPNSPIQGLGAEKLAEYYRKFNLGQLTGIDLPGEKPGRVADPEWKQEYFKNDPIMSKWYLGDTYHISIGQGDMLATPLQVAEWTAVIANNGTGYKPQLMKKIVNDKGDTVFENKPQVLVSNIIDKKYLKIVQEGMRQTVTSGSGAQLATLPVEAAGKTGTSQFDGSDPTRTHAWFTAYAPFNDPQIVITVLVEAGGEGHIASVPIVKKALKWWAENRYLH